MDIKEAFDQLYEALPDWAKGGRLLLIHNTELVARKFMNEPWTIKDVRCNQCGDCCYDVPANYFPWGPEETGPCPMLGVDSGKSVCKLGKFKPLCCLEDPEPSNQDCCIRYL